MTKLSLKTIRLTRIKAEELTRVPPPVLEERAPVQIQHLRHVMQALVKRVQRHVKSQKFLETPEAHPPVQERVLAEQMVRAHKKVDEDRLQRPSFPEQLPDTTTKRSRPAV